MISSRRRRREAGDRARRSDEASPLICSWSALMMEENEPLPLALAIPWALDCGCRPGRLVVVEVVSCGIEVGAVLYT